MLCRGTYSVRRIASLLYQAPCFLVLHVPTLRYHLLFNVTGFCVDRNRQVVCLGLWGRVGFDAGPGR